MSGLVWWINASHARLLDHRLGQLRLLDFAARFAAAVVAGKG